MLEVFEQLISEDMDKVATRRRLTGKTFHVREEDPISVAFYEREPVSYWMC